MFPSNSLLLEHVLCIVSACKLEALLKDGGVLLLDNVMPHKTLGGDDTNSIIFEASALFSVS